MIPRTVTVENFLSFGSPPVTFDFDRHPLWILCGPNGTGKSAVFDAITYALFGCFRGSDRKTNKAEELVHHDAKWLRVVFEFEYDGVDYRITRRKPKKGAASVSVAERRDRSVGEDGWQPREDINGVEQLDRWVRSGLGLSFDTFVCSILLRQGKAEEIIDADSKTRLKVLHGIIDIEKYRDLHARVAEKATDLERERKRLDAQLKAMPDAPPDALTEAQKAWDDAGRRSLNAREAARRVQERLGHARTWEALRDLRERVQRELNAAAQRDQREDEIGRQAARLRELRVVVPALDNLARFLGEVHAQTERQKQATHDLEAQVKSRDQLAAAAEQERLKADSHRRTSEQLAPEIAKSAADLEMFDTRLRDARTAARLRTDLHGLRARLDQFPADLDSQFAIVVGNARAAQTAREAAPQLESLVNDREAYRQGVSDRDSYEQARLNVEAERDQIQDEVTNHRSERERTDGAVRRAEAAETTARTRLTDACSRRDRFAALAGDERCSLCGQRIDERHALIEREQLAAAVEEAERELEGRERDTRAARDRRAASTGKTDDAETRLAAAAEQLRDAISKRNEASRRVNEADTRFQRIAARLPEPYRVQVTRIEMDGFPRAPDVLEVQQLAETYQTCAERVETLRMEQQTREGLVAQLDAKQQALEQLGPQPAPAVLELEREKLEADLLQMRESQRRASEDRKAAEGEAGRLAQESAAAGQEVTRLTGEQAAAESARAGAKSQATAERERLPAPWADRGDSVTDAERDRLRGELLGLVQSGVEAEAEALANDRAIRTNREQQLHDADEQIGRLPEDARCPVEQVQGQLLVAANEEDEAFRVLTVARERLEMLTRQDTARKQVAADLDQTGKDSDLHGRLAGLLGKKGLQLARFFRGKVRTLRLLALSLAAALRYPAGRVPPG
jgi:DNA repair exonuclease SbcCD ATPase subunit